MSDSADRVPLTLRPVPGRYAVARLPADAAIPSWADGPGFVAIARADDELTIVCRQDRVPPGTTASEDWACLRTVGPFAFQAAGVVRSLITPLSSNGIGVFVVCTFDGEHLLIAAGDLEQSLVHLRAAGHLLIQGT